MKVDYTEIDKQVLAGYRDPLPSQVEGVRLVSIQEQADLAEQANTHGLYFCKDAWAIRHRFVNHDSGEVKRARCDRWTCDYCGSRKTDQWRQLIEAAEPVLHVVLSRAGHTVEEAARALTTWVQYLRRGSKGRGRDHVGARPSFPIEYLAVLERHANFEETGFHWHILVKGVDYIPKDILDASWESATHGLNKWAYVDRVKKQKAVGYVTKYLTKDITRTEKGVREVQRERLVPGFDQDGKPILVKESVTVQMTSGARRIRYSRQFFPESVEALRFRLFSQIDDPEHPEQMQRDAGAVCGESSENEGQGPEMGSCRDEDSQVNDTPSTPRRSSWSLYEAEPYTEDYAEYKSRVRQAMLESLMKVRAGEWRISGRVLSVWSFQRSQKRRQDVRLAG